MIQGVIFSAEEQCTNQHGFIRLTIFRQGYGVVGILAIIKTLNVIKEAHRHSISYVKKTRGEEVSENARVLRERFLADINKEGGGVEMLIAGLTRLLLCQAEEYL